MKILSDSIYKVFLKIHPANIFTLSYKILNYVLFPVYKGKQEINTWAQGKTRSTDFELVSMREWQFDSMKMNDLIEKAQRRAVE